MSVLKDPIGWLEDHWYRRAPRGDVTQFLVNVLAELRPTPMLLDLGAGTGDVSRRISEHMRARFVLADIDAEALEQGSPDHERVLLTPSNPLPFKDRTFDGVFLVDVVHHLPSPQRTLLEVHRVLRPHGVLLIVEYDRALAATRALSWVCRLVRGHRMLTAHELERRVREAGFRASSQRLDGLRVGVVAEPSPPTP